MTELRRRMTSLDASFLYLERPNALLHVAGLYAFDERLDFDAFVDDVERRLPLIPRYVQRVEMVPFNLGHPTWEQDERFDIRNHVRRHELAPGADDRALAALCAKLFAEPLHRSRPLWEMHFIDGYGSGCAVFAKTHHCMIDGASGMQLIDVLMDPTPKPRPLDNAALPIPSPPPSPFARTLEGLVSAMREQMHAGEKLWKTLRDPGSIIEDGRQTIEAAAVAGRNFLEGAPSTPFNGPLGIGRSMAWTPLSLNEVKAIRNRLGGTVNDVVLTVIAGGIRNYLRDLRFHFSDVELKVAVPVNVRAEHEKADLGNRVSLMMGQLPISVIDPVERLRCVAASMDLLKESGQSVQMERLLGLTEVIPPALQAPLAQLQPSRLPVNTVCTNVPGPRVLRYVLGKQVRFMVPMVPLGAGIGLAFAIMSYSDQLTIGIAADAELVPDPWKVADGLNESYEELWAATGLERVARDRRIGSALERRRRFEPPADPDDVPPQSA